MPIVEMVLVLLLAVVASRVIAALIPANVPLPLLQIAFGAALSWAFDFNVRLDPPLFLLLFIPPLLFLDGFRIPKGGFFRDWQPILALAVGLVMFTVAGLGWLVHWLIPAIPLAVAFALAAILSPTDPVSVAAMTAKAPIPPRLMRILEGEALLNDASGLVCFSFAVAATLTGEFSLPRATLSFLFVGGGGLLVGATVSWSISLLNRQLVRTLGEEPATQILISILIPFAAYLAAEHLHVSGVLAAAVAGIVMHYRELANHQLVATRIQRATVWDTVQVTLNGMIFLLLGEQLPRILHSLPDVAAFSGLAHAWQLLAYLLLITFALGALRFLWVWVSMRLTLFYARWHGEHRPRPSLRLLAITAVGGVRGTITLAGILALPMLMPDGSPFPARDAAIFLATGVILLSLLAASIGLPLLTRGLPELPRSARGDNEEAAREAASKAAICRIERILATPPDSRAQADIRAEAGTLLLDRYRRRLDYGRPDGEDARHRHALVDAERRLRIQALHAEREELFRLRRLGRLDDEVHRRLVRELDLLEASLARDSLAARAQ